MKLTQTVSVCGVATAALAGCFSMDLDRPEERTLGAPVALTSLDALNPPAPGASLVSGFLAMDVSVDPDTGDLIVAGSDAGYGGVAVVRRGTGEVLARFELESWTNQVTAVGDGRVMVRSGGENLVLELPTGAATPVAGLDDLRWRTPPVMDSSGGDLVTLECEPHRGSPIEVWSGPATSRTRVRSTALRTHVDGVGGLAYVPDQDVVLIATDHGVLSVSLTTGDAEDVYADVTNARGLAYESATGRLLVLKDAAGQSVLEFDL
jgi:hypothetical protein